MLTAADFSSSDTGMHHYSLKFRNKKLEKNYKRLSMKSNRLYLKVMYYLLLLIFGGYTIGDALLVGSDGSQDSLVGFVRLIFIIIFLVLGISFFMRFIEVYYEKITFGVPLKLFLSLANF